ncbi:hypothetical protein [Ochrobactrum sp. RH2CCR150]|uniref:hypothetical protein n=1 Tax=Ochrobactrum sp. RH2CCR150 TaxID=2587044 RepID=UPI0015F867AB|nr:hypothetical protein [Ochrobactrum sp. RH2CCR150]
MQKRNFITLPVGWLFGGGFKRVMVPGGMEPEAELSAIAKEGSEANCALPQNGRRD